MVRLRPLCWITVEADLLAGGACYIRATGDGFSETQRIALAR